MRQERMENFLIKYGLYAVFIGSTFEGQTTLIEVL